uniref:Uncharacterized protein n=1 Tax=viral metagenome TaxID=1070528 RepID=A0A6C0JIL0_9ZZZZ
MARTQSNMSLMEMSDSIEELANKYETLWEQVDTLYKDGVTMKHVESAIEKYVGQINGRIDLLNSKTHDRIEVLSNKVSDIIENDIGKLTTHERSNYNQIRGILEVLDGTVSDKNDWVHFQITLLQSDNRTNKALIQWMFYTIVIMFIIILYKFYN